MPFDAPPASLLEDVQLALFLYAYLATGFLVAVLLCRELCRGYVAWRDAAPGRRARRGARPPDDPGPSGR
jgi:hypothetical protein